MDGLFASSFHSKITCTWSSGLCMRPTSAQHLMIHIWFASQPVMSSFSNSLHLVSNWPVVSPDLQQRHYSAHKTSSYILNKSVHVQLSAYSFLFFFFFFSLQANYISYQLTLSTCNFAKFSHNVLHVCQYTLQIKYSINYDSFPFIHFDTLLMAFFHQGKMIEKCSYSIHKEDNKM